MPEEILAIFGVKLTMTIINFSHPVTADQKHQIESLSGQAIGDMIEVPCQMDHSQPFDEQVRQLVESVGLSSAQWQSLPLIINMPSLNFVAALVLAELHGRIGYFPSILRLRPVAGCNPPRFEVAEIISLQKTRDAGREAR